MTYWFHPEAEEELHQAFDYYESRQAGLGQRFADEFRNALKQVIEHPLMWAVLEAPYRLRRLKRFPYGLLYDVRGEVIVIVAVMHLHRRPGYWRTRLL
jgi:plasmid stabilization system protein ParE